MALIKCPECGKKVSDKINACIHCGYPLEKYKEEKYKNEINKKVNEMIEREFSKLLTERSYEKYGWVPFLW